MVPSTSYKSHHARRPPLKIYNVSAEQLTADFEKVLDEYEKTREFITSHQRNLPVGDNYYENLLDAQKNLIHSLQAHIDDCYSILATLVDTVAVPAKAAKIRFTDRWLDAVGFPTLAQFRKVVSECRDKRLPALVNGLKHRQNRLRGVFFHSPREVRRSARERE